MSPDEDPTGLSLNGSPGPEVEKDIYGGDFLAAAITRCGRLRGLALCGRHGSWQSEGVGDRIYQLR
jgi:hypothetical protein